MNLILLYRSHFIKIIFVITFGLHCCFKKMYIYIGLNMSEQYIFPNKFNKISVATPLIPNVKINTNKNNHNNNLKMKLNIEKDESRP